MFAAGCIFSKKGGIFRGTLISVLQNLRQQLHIIFTELFYLVITLPIMLSAHWCQLYKQDLLCGWSLFFFKSLRKWDKSLNDIKEHIEENLFRRFEMHHVSLTWPASIVTNSGCFVLSGLCRNIFGVFHWSPCTHSVLTRKLRWETLVLRKQCLRSANSCKKRASKPF